MRMTLSILHTSLNCSISRGFQRHVRRWTPKVLTSVLLDIRVIQGLDLFSLPSSKIDAQNHKFFLLKASQFHREATLQCNYKSYHDMSFVNRSNLVFEVVILNIDFRREQRRYV